MSNVIIVRMPSSLAEKLGAFPALLEPVYGAPLIRTTDILILGCDGRKWAWKKVDGCHKTS